jgi:hypothetical protein
MLSDESYPPYKSHSIMGKAEVSSINLMLSIADDRESSKLVVRFSALATFISSSACFKASVAGKDRAGKEEHKGEFPFFSVILNIVVCCFMLQNIKVTKKNKRFLGHQPSNLRNGEGEHFKEQIESISNFFVLERSTTSPLSYKEQTLRIASRFSSQ